MNRLCLCVSAFSLTLCMASLRAMGEDQRILVQAKHVITGDGKEYSPGEVFIKNGKIAFVGKSIELSLPAETIQAHTVMPGLVNVATNIGLSGGDAEVSREITPDFDTLSAIDWRSRDFAEALNAGETTVQVLPDTQSVFSGFATVVKTVGDESDRVVKDENSVVLAISSDPTSRNRSRSRPDSIYVRQPTNRMGVVWIVRSVLHRAAQKKLADTLSPAAAETLRGITKGERSVVAVSRTDFDILSAFTLGNDHGFKPVICGGDEVYRVIDEFKETGASLIYTALETNATASALRGREGTELRWNVPGLLAEQGVTFCLAGEGLLEQARFAHRFGLSREQAIASVTSTPAKIIGVSDRVGTLAADMDADLVALSGDPLQPTTAVVWTMVNGQR